ncbi:MAG: DUF3598 family protein [Cyanobium sp. M30B3]|jgi:hypothetical protein|nr:MAG: DUF3598 family protein [Cyanobium sp. M30B3]
MASQWQNFLRNQGEWQGSFTSLSPAGELLSQTPSLLSLESAEEGRLVRFRLRRYGPEGRDGPPSSDHQQEYRSLGRQVVFFDSGAFSKGSMQVAPGSAFGVETGFVSGDRRHRLVQLYDATGHADQLVLIREFRLGSDAVEQPPLHADLLLGPWRGEAATVTADWPEADRQTCALTLTPADLTGLVLLADGGYSRRPAQVSHRQAFSVEAGWLLGADRLERLIRRYDSTGAWLSSRHECLQRC